MSTPSPTSSTVSDTAFPDRLTVVGIALFAYAVSNVLHEAVGHGGACVVLGGSPVALSSVHFECDNSQMSTLAFRGVAAAGTIVNFVVGALAFVALGLTSARKRPHTFYFLWLFATLNLLMGAGYFLFSGVGDIGDWSAVAQGLVPPGIWRPAMAVFGMVLYFVLARQSARALRPLVGNDALSLKRGRQLAIPAYLAGGLLYCVSGLFNPVGPILIAISAAAASFGGASGLLWLTALLRHFPGSDEAADLDRSYAWVAAGVVASILFIVVLGPSIQFGP